MGAWVFFSFMVLCLSDFFQTNTCMASSVVTGRLKPGFQGAQSNFIDDAGMFLFSNSSIFGLGFTTSDKDVTMFLLAIVHLTTSRIVWSANGATPVRNTDNFVFNDDGNVILQSGGSVIWSTDTGNEGVFAMELQDSGNLVLLGNDDIIVWQSFDHPADSLLSNQEFRQGMKLVSNPSTSNLTYSLEIKSGDMRLYANFRNPQPYWSIRGDNRKIIENLDEDVSTTSLVGNSWKFYNKSRVVLWQMILSDLSDTNFTWVATLGHDGYITFYDLQNESGSRSPTKIPADSCSRPEPCKSYEICYNGTECVCPSVLGSKDICGPGILSPCKESEGSIELINAGNGLSYFALGLVSPSSKTNLDACKSSCLANCSCLTMFYEEKFQNCFHFDSVGSLKGSDSGSNFVSYIKVSRIGGNVRDPGEHRGNKKKNLLIVAIVMVTTLVVGVLYVIIRYYQKKNIQVESPQEEEEEEEDIFVKNMSGMPIRFSHYDLQVATNNFKKSDVYSYGMLLLEIIGGRRNYYASETEEQSNFPLYAFKMMEQGKLKDILDVKLRLAEDDERVAIAIKIALWCIQDDMHLRPSMTKVVKMLEQVSPVPPPPSSQRMNPVRPFDINSNADLSAIRLSGPR
ncbi:Receptor-like serine/threonine-protein kinase [Heracleum sosnowskyi]|uniref:Receptor-like serine/threonine-protein kinase n=1 Tax=Heracleum sosnowskyi TaxID=360622 RepID=A0AAD8HNT3_9APIA|nr:Receptor-like serine/threonine-protein kinase [Heracleum sosnowskyi]